VNDDVTHLHVNPIACV